MKTQQISLAVLGMRQAVPGCAADLQQALTRLDGVVTAQVNYASERATIIFDPARVTVLEMVNVLRRLSFDTPLHYLTLYSDDLLYASSPETIKNALGRVDGVVASHIAIRERTVTIDLIPEHPGGSRVTRALTGLGFKPVGTPSSTAESVFLMRTLIVTLIAALSLWSAGAHAGWFASPGSLHTPLVVAVLSLVALLGAGFPFYQFAFDALLSRELDTSVLLALLSSTFGIASIPLGLLIPSTLVTDLGFLIATLLTSAWFLARAFDLTVTPWWARRRAESGTMTSAGRHYWIPILSGLVAATAMLGVYLGILSLLQSPAHALEQLTTDGLWVGLIALGFGIQIGLYTHLRMLIHVAQATGATAITGGGTVTSTLGMLACCAHHLSDVAPLVALTGTGGLSGAVGLFTEFKYAFVGVGIVMNLVGIAMTLLTIRKCHDHASNQRDHSADPQPAVACH